MLEWRGGPGGVFLLLPMNPRSKPPLLSGVRLVLLAGFLGLLCLLGFAGFYSLHALRQVARTDDESTREFVKRSDALEMIRQNAYTSTSRVRDFLLDREPKAPQVHRQDAVEAWTRALSAVKAYSAVSPEAQRPAFQQLRLSMEAYWHVAEPALSWRDTKREVDGYDLLAEQLTPRRDEFLHLCDELRRANELDLRAAIEHSASLISLLQQRLAMVVLLALLIGAALAGITLHYFMRLERAASQRYEASIADRAQLEALSTRLLEIQEEERRRISRELHDEAGQALSGLLVDVANASAEIQHDQPSLKERMASIKRSAESTLSSIRNLSLLLRPSMLDDLGLIAALRWQARETARRSGMEVAVLAEDYNLELPDEYRTTIYRVVQEALNNAARHSEAKNVSILVRAEARRLLVLIQDDGKGFDPDTTKGMGLLGMQERIAHLNGQMEVESGVGQGVVVRIELPPVPAGKAA